MRQFLRIICMALCLFLSIKVFAYDAKINGIYYNFLGNSAIVTYQKDDNYGSYSDYSGSVVIPSSVFYNGKSYNVTSIGDYAFIGCHSLTSVTIPSSVTTISDHAFYGCWYLTSVTIPYSVIDIGSFAFAECGLTSVNISNGVTTIGESAFEHCDISSIVIPSSVTSIGEGAFSGCFYLTSIKVDNGNTKYDSRNDCNAIIETGTNNLIAGCKNTIIPNNVTTIGNQAFCQSGLTTISIPDKVTSIGNRAFYSTGLSAITIPNRVTNIGEYAFAFCQVLTSVTIPNSIKTIGRSAFYYCSNLADVYCYAENIPNTDSYVFYNSPIASATLHVLTGALEAYKTTAPWSEFGSIVAIEEDSPSIIFADANVKTLCVANWDTNGDGELSEAEAAAVTDIEKTFRGNKLIGSFEELKYFTGLTSIEDNAFYDCSGLTSVIIPGSVTSIGYYAFLNCSGLTSVTIPGSVTSIGDGAFSGCSGLTSVTIPSSVTSIGNYAFCNCSGLTSVTIPESVTSIGNYAFYGCSGLTSVTIPGSVTSIGYYAFLGCSGLNDVYCYAENVPTTGNNAFTSWSIASATLHVPAGSLEQYKATEPWSRFGSIVPIEGYTTYNINDEMASLSIASEESGCIVNFTHDFNGEWEALCLPFAIDYDAIKADFDLAEIDGVVQNDDNNDGIIDFTVLSIRGFKEQTTEPNTPYLIRAKNAGEQTISFEDITVYPTTITSVDCSSTSTKYEFTGSYNALNASALADRYIINNGELVKGGSHLAPCRWYMTATARKGSLNLPAKIRIMPVEDVITGSPLLTSPEEDGKVYNLDGLRLSKMQKGINIKDGKKVMIK